MLCRCGAAAFCPCTFCTCDAVAFCRGEASTRSIPGLGDNSGLPVLSARSIPPPPVLGEASRKIPGRGDISDRGDRADFTAGPDPDPGFSMSSKRTPRGVRGEVACARAGAPCPDPGCCCPVDMESCCPGEPVFCCPGANCCCPGEMGFCCPGRYTPGTATPESGGRAWKFVNTLPGC